MSREERNTPSHKGLGEVKGVSTESDLARGELHVTVLSFDTTLFERYINDQFDIIGARWESFKSTDTPITRDEFMRYCYTAVRTRVARVRDEKFHIRCDSEWQLITGLATILAQIGRVTSTSLGVTIIPKWNDALNEYLLSTREEFQQISMKLRMMAREPHCKFIFADAISGDKRGDETVMALIPVRNELGQLVLVRGQKDFDAVAGVAYLLLDLHPEGIDGAALSGHPLLLPPYFIRRAVVETYMTRYAEISVG